MQLIAAQKKTHVYTKKIYNMKKYLEDALQMEYDGFNFCLRAKQFRTLCGGESSKAKA